MGEHPVLWFLVGVWLSEVGLSEIRTPQVTLHFDKGVASRGSTDRTRKSMSRRLLIWLSSFRGCAHFN
jgi:hypothetical protein